MVTNIIALDLGATQIRAVEAEIKNGAPPKIKQIHTMPLDSGIVSSGEIVRVDDLTQAIKKLWEEAKFKTKRVITMASGNTYENREILDVPWSPEEDSKKLVGHYVKDKVPFELSDYELDSHTLDEYFKAEQNSNGELMKPQHLKRILLVAVSKEHTKKLIEVIEGAGLQPCGIDAQPLALIRSQLQLTDIPERAVVVNVEIGGEIITIAIHKNGQPIYTHKASYIGGMNVTSRIQSNLHITFNDAEMLKTSFSVRSDERHRLSSTNFSEDGLTTIKNYNDFSTEQIESTAGIISGEVTNVIAHIRDVLIDAFGDSGETPFRIILSGGGSGLHSLLSRTQQELSIPTFIAKPLENIKGNIEPEHLANQHMFAPVLGLLVGQNEIK